MYLGSKITQKQHIINKKRAKGIDRKNLLSQGSKGLRPLDNSVVDEDSDELRESVGIDKIPKRTFKSTRQSLDQIAKDEAASEVNINSKSQSESEESENSETSEESYDEDVQEQED